jgi:hypothetical protein
MLTPNYENDPCRPAARQETHQRIATWLKDFFQRNPDVSRQDFLLHAIKTELAYRERRDTTPWPRAAHAGKTWTASPAAHQSPPAEEARRAEDLVAERLMALNYQRHGLWPRIQRFLTGKWNENEEA